jgi:membrane protease YdiL (CAAX protease family)
MARRFFDYLQNELKFIWDALRESYQEVVVLAVACLALILNHYHPTLFCSYDVTDFVLYFCFPLLVGGLLLKKPPWEFGLRLGDWRRWSFHVVVSSFVIVPATVAMSYDPGSAAHYEGMWSSLEEVPRDLAGLFWWEFLFRGFIFFGLLPRLGKAAIVVQTVPFVLMHFGKPELETLLCIPMGLYYGYVAMIGRSIIPAFLIHVIINVAISLAF